MKLIELASQIHFLKAAMNYSSDRPYMDVSENGGTPKTSILIGCSIINHPFEVPVFLETPICVDIDRMFEATELSDLGAWECRVVRQFGPSSWWK